MNKQWIFRVVRFGLSGAIGTILGYGIFYSFTKYLGLWYLVSLITSCIITEFANFMMKKYWVFRNKDSNAIHRQMILYFIIGGAYTLINAALLFTFVNFFHLDPFVSQIALIVIISICSYFTTHAIFSRTINSTLP